MFRKKLITSLLTLFAVVVAFGCLASPAFASTAIPYPTPINCNPGPSFNPLLVPACAVKQFPVLAMYLLTMTIILGAVAALAFFLYAGWNYAFAEDDTGKAERARLTMRYAIIGLILAASAYVLVRTFANALNVRIFTYLAPPKAYAQEQQVQTVQLSGRIRNLETRDVMAGVQVSLYWLHNGRWEVWPAQQYNNQRNPYRTDVFGQYQFFVPPGQYYVVGNKIGFFEQASEAIEVKASSVSVDVYLKPGVTIWLYLLIVGIVAFFSALAYIIIRRVNRWRKREEIKSYLKRQIRGDNEPNGTGRP